MTLTGEGTAPKEVSADAGQASKIIEALTKPETTVVTKEG